MDADADDPFGSIFKQCQITSSQEKKLQKLPFARESEPFSDDYSWSSSPEHDDVSVEPTGIVMVSLPDSQDDRSTIHEEEDFHTPPEHSHSNPSSQEQRPIITAVEPSHAGQQIKSGDDSIIQERTVDLGKDSDNLGFSEPKLNQRTDSNPSRFGNGVSGNVAFNSDLEELRALESGSSESVSKKLRTSEEYIGLKTPIAGLGNTEPIIIESNCIENVSTEILQTEIVEIDEELELGKDTMNVDSIVEPEEVVRVGKSDKLKENGDGGLCKNNAEEIDKFKYVGSGKVDRRGKKKDIDGGVVGRRELPFSLTGQEKNVGEKRGTESISVNNQAFKNLLKALKVVVGEMDADGFEDEDFMDIVKRRGMTFPRPSYWSPEGSKD